MSEWADQWKSCIYVNGSEEDHAEASLTDRFWHYFTFPWNLLFCLVPPNGFFHGWAGFYVSLLFIAVLTAVISDLAELIGCVLQVPDVCTAITFVALGTSMPDLFASLSAAKADPTADAAIVNVTGSNAVNIFLGLGGPWSMAAIYWSTQERVAGSEWELKFPQMAEQITDRYVFVVESRNLGFSVLVFAMAFCVAFCILVARRKLVGAELGGPVVVKWVSFGCYISMWIGWIGVVSWRVIRYDQILENWTEQMIMAGGVGSLQTIIAIAAMLVIVTHWRRNRKVKKVEEDIVVQTVVISDEEAENAAFEVVGSGFGRFARSRTLSAETWSANSLGSASLNGSLKSSELSSFAKKMQSFSEEDEIVLQDHLYESQGSRQGSKNTANWTGQESLNAAMLAAKDDSKELFYLGNQAVQLMAAAESELGDLEFPQEHESPPVLTSMHVQMVSHSENCLSSNLNGSPPAEYGGAYCANCCTTPR